MQNIRYFDRNIFQFMVAFVLFLLFFLIFPLFPRKWEDESEKEQKKRRSSCGTLAVAIAIIVVATLGCEPLQIFPHSFVGCSVIIYNQGVNEERFLQALQENQDQIKDVSIANGEVKVYFEHGTAVMPDHWKVERSFLPKQGIVIDAVNHCIRY